MHKYKESDTRKRNELPNEAAGVWNESDEDGTADEDEILMFSAALYQVLAIL